jgi:Fe2+ transport system protein B
MKKIDFSIEARFQGKDVKLAKTNGENIEKLQDEFDKLKELGDLTAEYENEREEILNSDLSDDEKQENLEKITKKFNDKTEKFKDSIVEHRKRVCDIMIDEWVDGEPDEEFYSDKKFDDFALNRLVSFFLTPKGATLN